jgi:hypothetical protein
MLPQWAIEHEKGDRGRFTLTIRELPWLLVQQKDFCYKENPMQNKGMVR